MTQALTIFRSERKAISITPAAKAACRITGKSSGLTKTSKQKMNSPKRRIYSSYLPWTIFSSRQYRYPASRPIASAIRTSMADLLSDLKMLLKVITGKMNKTGNLLFGVVRKRRQRKPFRGLHLLSGSHHSEVSVWQATVACKDPVAPVALMTSGSFECAAAGLRGSVTPPREAHCLQTSCSDLELLPMPLGDCEDPVFHLDCVRPAGHNAQAISVVEAAYQTRLTLARGRRVLFCANNELGTMR